MLQLCKDARLRGAGVQTLTGSHWRLSSARGQQACCNDDLQAVSGPQDGVGGAVSAAHITPHLLAAGPLTHPEGKACARFPFPTGSALRFLSL